jgi:phosphoglycerate dehydrogenase-like enzyme
MKTSKKAPTVLYVSPGAGAEAVLDRVRAGAPPFEVSIASLSMRTDDPALALAEFVLLHGTEWPVSHLEAAVSCRAIVQLGDRARCDLEAARERGIFVSDASSSASEQTLAFASARMKEFLQDWNPRNPDSPPRAPRRPRAGLLGLGRLGERLAGAAKADGFDIWANDPFALDEVFERADAHRAPTIEDLLGLSDLLLTQVPACEANEKLVSARELELMRPGGWLVNLGWTESIDAAAAIQARKSGRLGRLILNPPMDDRTGLPEEDPPEGSPPEGNPDDSPWAEWVELPAEQANADIERGLDAAFNLIASIARGEEPGSLLIDPPCPRQGR